MVSRCFPQAVRHDIPGPDALQHLRAHPADCPRRADPRAALLREEAGVRCVHEFFKPGSLKCARCGEPGRYPSSAMSRHTRVGKPDSLAERWIADRERPAGARAKHATRCPYANAAGHADRCGLESRMVGDVLVRATGVQVAIATAEMRGAA